jgi:3-hydroxyacyl-CoA dehydrogenase/enoyl-CoA hydratase/3-hydroxybutyryl-CoA epimerase
MLSELERRISESLVRVVILYSAKKNSFIVGADLNMLYAVTDAKAAEKVSSDGQRLLTRIASLQCPTVAAINVRVSSFLCHFHFFDEAIDVQGACLGGGLEVALACGHRVAAQSPHVALGLPEVMVGLLPGAGGVSTCVVVIFRVCETERERWIVP